MKYSFNFKSIVKSLLVTSLAVSSMSCGQRQQQASIVQDNVDSSGSIYFLEPEELKKYEVEARKGSLSSIKKIVDHYAYAFPENDKVADLEYGKWLKIYIDRGGNERIIDYIYYMANRKMDCKEIKKYFDIYRHLNKDDSNRVLAEYDYVKFCLDNN